MYVHTSKCTLKLHSDKKSWQFTIIRLVIKTNPTVYTSTWRSIACMRQDINHGFLCMLCMQPEEMQEQQERVERTDRTNF